MEKNENLKSLINLIIAQQIKELIGDDAEDESEGDDMKEDKKEAKAPKWSNMLKGMK